MRYFKIICVGILFSVTLTAIIQFSWLAFRVFVLGYGESGPSWIISVNNCLYVVGLASGVALTYNYYKN